MKKKWVVVVFLNREKSVSNYKQGGIAKGCGGVLDNRRKVTKKY
jgi:hypothetical protein